MAKEGQKKKKKKKKNSEGSLPLSKPRFSFNENRFFGMFWCLYLINELQWSAIVMRPGLSTGINIIA